MGQVHAFDSPRERPLPIGSVARIDAGAPSLLIFRLVLEVQLACNAACDTAIEAITGRRTPLNRSAFLLLILRCHSALAATPDHQAASRSPGGISVSAIAASFGQPFETSRRHANALIRDGICERRGARVSIRREMFDHPAFLELLTDLRAILKRFVAALAAAGITMPEARAGAEESPLLTVAAAIDLSLAAYEYCDLFGSWLTMRVHNAIFAANHSDITRSAALSQRFACDEPLPPAKLLVPVSSTGIADMLRISTATARRQVRIAIEEGFAERCDGGLILTRKMYDVVRTNCLAEALSRRAIKIVERLVKAGLGYPHRPSKKERVVLPVL